MKVFVTGGTGFIGSVVVEELLGNGHEVLGLARSDSPAQKLRDAGAEVIRGELTDLDALTSGSSAADGVIHLGFSHDFSRYDEAVAMDLAAVEAIGAALDGTDKPFVNTGGTLGLAVLGRTATENDATSTSMPRGESEALTISLAERGVRSSVVRLAPCVHDVERQGFASQLVGIAVDKGVSAYVGEGGNAWPAVHRRDAARLFRLALEGAPAGTRLNAAGEEALLLRSIVETIGERLGVPVRSLSAEQAEHHFGFFAQMVVADNPTSCQITRELLGWTPENPGLLEDIDSFFARRTHE